MVNADNIAITTASPEHPHYDKNLFAYCDNNPVVREDAEGEWWVLAGAAAGLLIQYACDITDNIIKGKRGLDIFQPTSSWVDYDASTVSGMLTVSGVSAVGSIVGNAAISSVGYIANQIVSNKSITQEDLIKNTVMGADVGFMGGAGINGKALHGINKTANTVLKSAKSFSSI